MSFLNQLLDRENVRQSNTVELIASENFISKHVDDCLREASILNNKYAEGYPDLNRKSGNRGRYYGGCEIVDRIEEYCCDLWRKVFHTDYHVNVQPHSGSNANYAAYAAFLNIGDTILAMDLSNGGHLTHGSPVNFSGKLYNFISYGVDKSGYIDFNDIEDKLKNNNVRMIVAGASAYPRDIQYKKFKELADKYNCIFMVDMAHPAGLIAEGFHSNPFGLADVITTTTHKTLGGSRGGLIFSKPEYAKMIDSAVFPGSQGGPLLQMIAGKCATAEEIVGEEVIYSGFGSYHDYIGNVVKNCKAMADEFIRLGYKLITNGTDNHLILLDLTDTGLTGLEVQDGLSNFGYSVNKNMIPNDKQIPKYTSGIRLGSAAMTRRGKTEKEFISYAGDIDLIIKYKINKK